MKEMKLEKIEKLTLEEFIEAMKLHFKEELEENRICKRVALCTPELQKMLGFETLTIGNIKMRPTEWVATDETVYLLTDLEEEALMKGEITYNDYKGRIASISKRYLWVDFENYDETQMIRLDDYLEEFACDFSKSTELENKTEYRLTKSKIIKAIRFDDNIEEVEQFVADNNANIKFEYDDYFNVVSVRIITSKGVVWVDPGNYIIKAVGDDFYTCKPDVFKKNYEEEEI